MICGSQVLINSNYIRLEHFCEISGYHVGCLLGCCRSLPTFQRCLMLPSSGQFKYHHDIPHSEILSFFLNVLKM
jgi:hypothetical protein